ncbi:MAG: nicotinate-nicotinamide nucleotide adenylyltransferase [Candidatus Woesebacteria bacterium]|jgi:nicotinate-nucleotide adenylyltransferase
MGKKKEEKIALFGGAFDPPHLGHSQVSRALLEAGIADQLCYVPAGVHDFQKNMTAVEHRVAMLELILNDDLEGEISLSKENRYDLAQRQNSALDLKGKIRIEFCEIEREGVSHTFDTLEELSARYPEKDFFWVIGSDNLAKFHLWYNYEEMLRKYRFYVYPRTDYPFEPLYQNMIPLRKMKAVDVSSTEIRQRVKEGKSITGMINAKVEKYIKKHKLYKTS